MCEVGRAHTSTPVQTPTHERAALRGRGNRRGRARSGAVARRARAGLGLVLVAVPASALHRLSLYRMDH